MDLSQRLGETEFRMTLREKQEFYEAVMARLETLCPQSDFRLLDRARRPWIRKPLGTPRSGLYLDAFQVQRPMYVGFYSAHQRAPLVYRELLKRKPTIQAAFSETLSWHNPGLNREGCNVVLEVPFDISAVSDRRRALPWVSDRLRRFDEVFQI